MADEEVPPFPTLEEFNEQTTEMKHSLFTNVVILRSVIDQCEALIRKRWLKKSQTQRKTLLLKVWPQMHKEHRPDFAAMRTTKLMQHRVINTFLWPQVNLEDLMKPKHLLLFLNARGRHPPHIFAQADIEAAAIGHAKEGALKGHMENYYMVFRRRIGMQEYGQLIHCTNSLDAAKKIAWGFGVHPGHRIQILGIQQRIWEFLVDCCLEILHDVSLKGVGDPAFVQPEPTPIPTDSGGCHSLDITSLEATYRVPIATDFSRMLSLVSSQRREAEDHIWALREDPSYFVETSRSYMDIDMHGNGGFVGLVTDAYATFNHWHDLTAQMTDLQKLWQDYATDIANRKTIPQDFQDAFETVRFTLECICHDYIHELSYGMYSCSHLQRFFDQKPSISSGDLPIKVKRKSKMYSEMSTEARLATLISYLWDDELFKDLGFVSLMDGIERLVQKDPPAKSLVTPWVGKMLGKLSVVAECLRQLHLFPDWAPYLELAMMIHKEKLLKGVEQRQRSWEKTLKTKFRAAPLE